MLWVLLEVFIEILNWRDMIAWLGEKWPPVTEAFRAMAPGLVIGRSLLFVALGVTVAVFFYRGARIARQCWDVYKVVDDERT